MFQKAKSGQAKIKIGIYGDAGSGKTPVALQIAEGLNKVYGGRTAVIDTERGTDFYVSDIPERKWHPIGFDIDVEYTKSVHRALELVKWAIESKKHSAIVIDSLTHFWENAIATYTGKRTKHGGIPLYAWAKIKAPFKELIDLLIESDKHVILCGRMANMYEDSGSDDKIIKSGTRMKSEGDTSYEPNILLCMSPRIDSGNTVISARVEKDRSSILYGKVIDWPSFDNIVKPILKYLSAGKQASVKEDIENDMKVSKEKEDKSLGKLNSLKTKIEKCNSLENLEKMKQGLSNDKSLLTQEHLGELYSVFSERKESLSKTSKSISDRISEV